MKKLVKIVLLYFFPLFIIWLIWCDASYREIVINYFLSIKEFGFEFSLSHLITDISFILIILGLNDYLDLKKDRKDIIIRVYNSYYFEDSVIIKSIIVVFVMTFIAFIFHVIFNFSQSPEIIVMLGIYYLTFIGKKMKLKEQTNKLNNDLVLKESALNKYNDLDDDQKRVVTYINSIIENSDENYFSIAVNGKWGDGKSSIINGFKEKFSENYEFLEINLWNTATPENSVGELKDKISNFINKAFIPIGLKELTYFNAFVSEFNNKVAAFGQLMSGYISTLESKQRLEYKLKITLNSLKKKTLIVIFDDIDRITPEYLNFYLKQIAYIAELKNVISITNIDMETVEAKLKSNHDSIAETKPIDTINFLDKIFSVRINTPYNQDLIRKYIQKNYDVWSTKINRVKIKNSHRIIDEIKDFTNSNPSIFNNYREYQQVFNDIITYYQLFNNKNIDVERYIPAKIIFILSILKYQFPNYYNEIIYYIKSHIDTYDKYNPVSKNSFITSVKKENYDIEEFKENLLLSDKVVEDKSGPLTQTIKYLKLEVQIQRLNHLLDNVIKLGLKNLLIAEKYVTNKIQEYDTTYEEIEVLKTKSLTINEITNMLYLQDELKINSHAYSLEIRINSFIENLRKVTLFEGNRLNAMIAILNACYFDENSLVKARYNNIPGVIYITTLFSYNKDNYKDLHEIEVYSFDYDSLFDIWAKVIDLENGFGIFLQHFSSIREANRLDILFSPRKLNSLISIGHSFFRSFESITEDEIQQQEEHLINKIWNHRFPESKFLKHILLLHFIQQHELFNNLHDEHSKFDIAKLSLILKNSTSLQKLIVLISPYILGDLNEPGFYEIISKYNFINNYNTYIIIYDIIFLNILIENDEFILSHKLLDYKDLFIQTVASVHINTLEIIVKRIRDAIIYRIEIKKMHPKLIVEFGKVFPECNWICNKDISNSDILNKLKEIKDDYN